MSELAEEIVEQRVGLLRVKLPEVGGGYELTCSPVLVQAVGSCAGVDFCFHAKYDKWEFQTENENGHRFPVGDPRWYVRREHYQADKPGTMSVEWAARILRRCLADWWQLRVKPGTLPRPGGG